MASFVFAWIVCCVCYNFLQDAHLLSRLLRALDLHRD